LAVQQTTLGWAAYLRDSDEDKQTPEHSFAMQRQHIREQLIDPSGITLIREYRDPPCSLLILSYIKYNHVSKGRGVFLVLKLEVFLLLRNTLITQLSSQESEFVLAQEGNIQYIDISAQVPDVPPIRELVKEVTSPRSSPSFHMI